MNSPLATILLFGSVLFAIDGNGVLTVILFVVGSLLELAVAVANSGVNNSDASS